MALAVKKLLKVTRTGKYHATNVSEEVRKFLEVSEGNEIAWFLEEGSIVVKST